MNQEDRELLELAAKAAGIDAQWDCPERGMIRLTPDGIDTLPWNPLTDDGDALRLMAKLRLVVHVWDDKTYVSAAKTLPDGDDPAPNSDAWSGCAVGADGDVAAATRRAIVRAAAEIGKSMKETNHG